MADLASVVVDVVGDRAILIPIGPSVGWPDGLN